MKSFDEVRVLLATYRIRAGVYSYRGALVEVERIRNGNLRDSADNIMVMVRR